MAQNSSISSSPRTHSSPLPSRNEPENPIVHAMWERLQQANDQSGHSSVPAILVGSNAMNVPCPARTVVSVGDYADLSFLHANRIDFLDDMQPGARRRPATGRSAVAHAGQSPQSFMLCDRFLVQGLNSGRGLFQFVSTRAHALFNGMPTSASKENPVIDQLQKAWNAKEKRPGSIVLGNRYAVMEFEKQSSDAMHCTYLLTVCDRHTGHQLKMIPLTQVAPPFTDRVLGAAQIEQANDLIKAHNALIDVANTAPLAASASVQHDPMIISYAGIGRNAALIAYREALSRMDEGLDAQGLDAALEDIVLQGRRDRGPRFMHCEKQLAALRDALMAEFSRRQLHAQTMDGPRMQSPSAAASRTASRLRREVAEAPPNIDLPLAEQRESNWSQIDLSLEEAADQSFDQVDEQEAHQGVDQEVDQEVRQEEQQEAPLCESLAENGGPEGVATQPEVAEPVTIELPEMTTAAAVTTTNKGNKREEHLQFIQTHANDSPLQFFESVAFKDPEVAAFCAVQEKRMITADSDFSAADAFQPSMHEEVMVYNEPSSFGLPQLRASEGSTLSQLQTGDQPYLRSTQVVLKDLHSATTAQSVQASASSVDPDTVFPAGLTCALRSGRFDPRDESAMPTKKLNRDDLISFILSSPECGLDLVEDLAAHNPAAATFLHFVDHALNFKHATKEQPTERYEYFEDSHQLREQQTHSGDHFLPVFLDGVRRNPDSDELGGAEWRVCVDKQWQTFDTKSDVIRHVLLDALGHLDNQQAAPGMPVYPLVVYDLLAKAVGVSVPSYLKDHENQIRETLAENRIAVEQRRQQIIEAQHETAILLEKMAVAQKKQFEKEDVTNSLQLDLVRGSGFPRSLAAESIDVTFSVSTNFSPLDALSSMRQRMVGHSDVPGTHRKQEISSRPHQLGREDNLCWLRSSWLSLFELASPEAIATRYDAIVEPIAKTIAPHNATIIQAIAQRYRDNPTEFMHAEHVGTGAHLGPTIALSDFLGDQIPAGVSRRVLNRNVEQFLRHLQINIAIAYRAKGSRLMAELENLSFSRAPASSDLPMALHRAMNVPLLVIEATTRARDTLFGRRVNRWGQLRIAAQAESQFGKQVELLASDAEPDIDKVKDIVRTFDDKPILWIEGGHYDLYLPNAAPRSDA